MVERWRLGFRATAVALIHAHNIHTQGDSSRGNPQDVLRLAGALEAVHQKNGQSVLPVTLPVTMGQNHDAGLDFDKTRFWKWQNNAPGEKKVGHGLPVSAAKAATRLEDRSFRLRCSHHLILNGASGEEPGAESLNAHF